MRILKRCVDGAILVLVAKYELRWADIEHVEPTGDVESQCGYYDMGLQTAGGQCEFVVQLLE